MKTKLYLAYGSNLNVAQMRQRCPTAEQVGEAVLKGWRLAFFGLDGSAVATVEKGPPESEVPVIIWRLTPRDEGILDIYEGYPVLYEKRTFNVELCGANRRPFGYVATHVLHYGKPSHSYFRTILQGYEDAGFDTLPLLLALTQKQGGFSL